MRGRAEYEGEPGRDLFEGVRASSLYPWASGDAAAAALRFDSMEGMSNTEIKNALYHADTGLLLGERGIGKTRFARKLASEIPSSFYILDKNTLVYKAVKQPSRPELVIADDLHYLLLAMRDGVLQNNGLQDEKGVLKMLQDIQAEARDAGAKLIFISDEGPSGLSYNFQNKDNEREFLTMLTGCVATPDDDIVLQKAQSADKHGSHYSVFRFRDNISNEAALNVRRAFNITDVPYRTLKGYWKREALLRWERLDERASHLNTEIKKIGQEQNMLRTPYLYPELNPELKLVAHNPSMCREKLKQIRESLVPLRTERDTLVSQRVGWWLRVNKGHSYLVSPDKEELVLGEGEESLDIANFETATTSSIRDLKVLHEEFGEISRKTLDIEIGTRYSNGWLYTEQEAKGVSTVMRMTASRLAGKDFLKLARELKEAKTEGEQHSAFLHYELAKD
ncbi:MAG: hypothetical protein HY366_00845 [Candidatus Aenigmarchaeota archaeon]|nr:hypothetical protein [Candidatus Aenigmarchaeota archaeon]